MRIPLYNDIAHVLDLTGLAGVERTNHILFV